MERPKKKKLNQRIQILHKFHLGSASCMCRNEEIYPFRLRNGPRIVFLAFHGDMPKKRKPRKRGFITASKFPLQAQQSVYFVLAGRKYALRGYSRPYWLAVGVSFLHIAVVECFLK